MTRLYLSNTPRLEALDKFLGAARIRRRTEKVKTGSAAGRVTAAPVFATLSMPGYHAAAMDGITVRAEETFGASDQAPLILEPDPGTAKGYAPVNTGNALPEGFNAVIKVEDLQFYPDGRAEILAPAVPWQHVRPVGEDVVAGELIVPSHRRLRPPDLGALLAGGSGEVEVLQAPVVAVIPTGSEVISPDGERKAGSVPDFNSTVISAYLEEWGARPVIRDIVPDQPGLIREAVAAAAAGADVVLIVAGSSAGAKDYTYQVIDDLGKPVLHGVATRPGKPTILGVIDDKPVVGLPGYPVSAYMSLEWFVKPLLYRYYGLPLPERDRLAVKLGRRVTSEMGMEEFIRMTVGHIDGECIANPLTRGAGVTMSMVRADGLLVIPANSLGHEQGEIVEIELYRAASELKGNLLAAGSHDLIIDLLSDRLHSDCPRVSLSSAHLGSMGGISAVGNGRAHLAGVHLFDPVTENYNWPYIRKIFPEKPFVLVNLAYRMQGWIVPPGNPDAVKTAADLAEKKISFINRQKGAGTRILFDHILKESGISPGLIPGYEREEYTHLGVAAAVAASSARAGLGILPAARAYGLDFVPLVEERYDLLMSDHFYRSSDAQILLEIIKDPHFKEQVEALGGYSMRHAGTLISED